MELELVVRAKMVGRVMRRARRISRAIDRGFEPLRAGWTVDAYDPQELFEAFVRRIAPSERGSYRDYVAWLEDLLGEDPLSRHDRTPGDGRGSLNVLARLNPSPNAGDREALRQFVGILRGLVWAEQRLGTDGLLDYARFMQELTGAVQAASFRLAHPPECQDLLVADLLDARGLSFSAVVLLGLAEGEFPQVQREDPLLRERAVHTGEFDPSEIAQGARTDTPPPVALALLPLIVVVAVNLAMSLFVLPRLDLSFLAEVRWGETSLEGVGGVWSVVTALACAIATVLVLHRRRLPALRETMDAGANASVLPALSVASLVGFGAVVAALPAFEIVREAVLGIGGGPLVSMAAAVNVLAALTGSASGGLTIALDALGPTYLARAAEIGMDPSLLHRVAVIGSGTLDSLPHNGAIVTLLAVCGSTHRESYRDIVMVGIVSAVIALVAVIVLGSMFGSF